MHEPINSKIWISVLGNFFYVMDVQTRSFNQKIQVHSDIIICIINFEKIKYYFYSKNLIYLDKTRFM